MTGLEDQLPLDPTDMDKKALDTTSFDIIIKKGQGFRSSPEDDQGATGIGVKDVLITNSTSVDENAEPTVANDGDKLTQAMEVKLSDLLSNENQANKTKGTSDSTNKATTEGGTVQHLEDSEDTPKAEDTTRKTVGAKEAPDDEQPLAKTTTPQPADNTASPKIGSTERENSKKEIKLSTEAGESLTSKRFAKTTGEDKGSLSHGTPSPNKGSASPHTGD